MAVVMLAWNGDFGGGGELVGEAVGDLWGGELLWW